MNSFFAIAAFLVLASLSPRTAAQKNLPVAVFKPGGTSFYRIHFKIDRDIKTKSALSLPDSPTEANIDFQGIVQVEVLPPDASASPGAIRLRTWLLTLAGDLSNLSRDAKPGDGKTQRVPSEGKFIDCALEHTGEIDQITGLDALVPEQQQAWREWAARFAAPFLVESENRKRGEKWSAEELETLPSPIADLRWQKRSQYVRDEPCAPLKFTPAGDFEQSSVSEPCALILTTSSLLQKSSPQDSTPADYKQRGLRTRGSAKGANEIILYISRKTGQLIRSTQKASQQMDVLIALADGTTRVHYDIHAKADSAVELISDLPLILQPSPPKPGAAQRPPH